MIAPTIQPIPLEALPQGERPIVFFDGECVMCNAFVDLMLQLDQDAKLRLTPLQGETAKRFLPPLPANRQEWTIYYLDETQLCDRSEAVIQICRRIGGWITPLSWGRFISLSIRDALYTLIARHRYNLFGKRDTCRVVTADERNRFLP